MGGKSFNKANYLTVKELSEIVKKSQQSVYRRLERKENKTKYMCRYDGRMYIHKSAVWDLYGVDIGFAQAEPEPEIHDREDALIQLLREQLAAKDAEIEKLHDALHREQLLHAETAGRLKDVSAKLYQIEQRQQEEPQKQEETANAEAEAAEQEEPAADAPPAAASVSEGPGPTDQEPQQKTFLERLKEFFGF